VPHFQYLWNGTADGTGPDGWPFVGYRMIAGVPLQAGFLDPVLAAHLAATLGELHAFPAAQAAVLGLLSPIFFRLLQRFEVLLYARDT